MNKKKWIAATLMIGSVLLTGCAKEMEETQNNDSEVVYFEGLPYSGKIFTEEKEGITTFIPEGQAEKVQKISGSWKENGFNGEAEITLNDHSVIEVKYQNGVPKGEAVRTYENGSYGKYRYQDGYPVGKMVYYTQSGEIIGMDSFYNNKLVSEWCANAAEAELEELLKNPKAYQETVIKFEGTVTDILESSDAAYIALKDQEGHTVLCTYKNTRTQDNQARIPRLEKGDRLTAFGFYEKAEVLDRKQKFVSKTTEDLWVLPFQVDHILEKLPKGMEEAEAEVDNQALLSTLPVMNLIYVDSEKTAQMDFSVLDSENPENYPYDLLVEYPYYMAGFQLSDEAEVIYEKVDTEKQKCMMLLQKKDSNQIYYAECKIREEDKLPVVGEMIRFLANLNGSYKMLYEGNRDKVEYLQVPRLNLTEIG